MSSYEDALRLRRAIEMAWCADTSYKRSGAMGSPYGQCAATAVVAHRLFEWDIVSADVHGQSHWFNRDDSGNDIDITADQFSAWPKVLFGPAGELWPDNYKDRSLEWDVLMETRARADLIIKRILLMAASPNNDPGP